MKSKKIKVEILTKDDELYCHSRCRFFKFAKKMQYCELFDNRLSHSFNGFIRCGDCRESQ